MAGGRAASRCSPAPSLSRLCTLVMGEAPGELAAVALLTLNLARRRPNVPAHRDGSAGCRDGRQFSTGVEDRISEPLGVCGVRDEPPPVDQAWKTPRSLYGPRVSSLERFQSGQAFG